jgi:hypothetical protein
VGNKAQTGEGLTRNAEARSLLQETHGFLERVKTSVKLIACRNGLSTPSKYRLTKLVRLYVSGHVKDAISSGNYMAVPATERYMCSRPVEAAWHRSPIWISSRDGLRSGPRSTKKIAQLYQHSLFSIAT